MFVRLPFVTLIFALAALGTPVRRSATQVEMGIHNMQHQTQMLQELVDALLPNGAELSQVVEIHEAAMEVDAAVMTATEDTTASDPFTKTETSDIIELVKQGVLSIQNCLNALVSKKADFTKVTSVVRSDLMKLKADTDVFADALLYKTPMDMKSEGQEQIDMINTMFDSAIAKFS